MAEIKERKKVMNNLQKFCAEIQDKVWKEGRILMPTSVRLRIEKMFLEWEEEKRRNTNDAPDGRD